MKINQKKQSYTASKVEATNFKAEHGYATSVTPTTKTFSIRVGADSL